MVNASVHETTDSWRALGKRFFDSNPWYIDYVSCAMARRLGYDTLQYPYRERHMTLIELVSCRDHCYLMPRFSLTWACVEGLRGPDGGHCACDESRDVVNCDRGDRSRSLES